MAVFQSLTLKNVLVSSYNQSASGGDLALGRTEQLSFNFTEIEGTFYDMAQHGATASKPFVQSYNLSKG